MSEKQSHNVAVYAELLQNLLNRAGKDVLSFGHDADTESHVRFRVHNVPIRNDENEIVNLHICILNEDGAPAMVTPNDYTGESVIIRVMVETYGKIQFALVGNTLQRIERKTRVYYLAIGPNAENPKEPIIGAMFTMNRGVFHNASVAFSRRHGKTTLQQKLHQWVSRSVENKPPARSDKTSGKLSKEYAEQQVLQRTMAIDG